MIINHAVWIVEFFRNLQDKIAPKFEKPTKSLYINQKTSFLPLNKLVSYWNVVNKLNLKKRN